MSVSIDLKEKFQISSFYPLSLLLLKNIAPQNEMNLPIKNENYVKKY